MKAVTPSHHPVKLIPEGIKLLPPKCFEGEHDGKSVKEFIAALKKYFHLVRLKNDNTRALFSKMHLTKLAVKCYCMRGACQNAKPY